MDDHIVPPIPQARILVVDDQPSTRFIVAEALTQAGYQVVRPHISRLRSKIEPDHSEPRIIRTLVGKGYLFSTG